MNAVGGHEGERTEEKTARSTPGAVARRGVRAEARQAAMKGRLTEALRSIDAARGRLVAAGMDGSPEAGILRGWVIAGLLMFATLAEARDYHRRMTGLVAREDWAHSVPWEQVVFQFAMPEFRKNDLLRDRFVSMVLECFPDLPPEDIPTLMEMTGRGGLFAIDASHERYDFYRCLPIGWQETVDGIAFRLLRDVAFGGVGPAVAR